MVNLPHEQLLTFIYLKLIAIQGPHSVISPPINIIILVLASVSHVV